MGSEIIKSFHTTYNSIELIVSNDFNKTVWNSMLQDNLLAILLISLPVFLVAMVVAIVSNVLQFKWKVTTKPLKPKFDKFNPAKGFKRIFSKDKIFDLIKSIVKIGMIFYMVYNELSGDWSIISGLYDISLPQAILLIGDIVIGLGLKISFIYLALGLIDFLYQKRKFKKDMRMTKQEIKDEYKNTEGDPNVKAALRQRRMQMLQQGMMDAVPTADFVVRNPTHVACALKYNQEEMESPKLVAKGTELFAKKIIDIAIEHQVPVIENPPVARALFRLVEVNHEIPPDLYKAVAEILLFVYNLRKDKKKVNIVNNPDRKI